MSTSTSFIACLHCLVDNILLGRVLSHGSYYYCVYYSPIWSFAYFSTIRDHCASSHRMRIC